MKVVAVNGSPRQRGNTADVLQAALAQAQQLGAETELMHLYRYTYSGCRSCFACKRIGGKSFGRCVLKDDAAPILENILSADVVLLGTPIYFGDMTAGLRALLERLWFPSLNYDRERTVNYPRDVVCGLLLTMNATADIYQQMYHEDMQKHVERLNRLVGPTDIFVVEDTLQFDDYSQYLSTMFDAQHKQKQHEEHYPQQQEQAAQWMKRLLEKAQVMKSQGLA